VLEEQRGRCLEEQRIEMLKEQRDRGTLKYRVELERRSIQVCY